MSDNSPITFIFSPTTQKINDIPAYANIVLSPGLWPWLLLLYPSLLNKRCSSALCVLSAYWRSHRGHHASRQKEHRAELQRLFNNSGYNNNNQGQGQVTIQYWHKGDNYYYSTYWRDMERNCKRWWSIIPSLSRKRTYFTEQNLYLISFSQLQIIFFLLKP